MSTAAPLSLTKQLEAEAWAERQAAHRAHVIKLRELESRDDQESPKEEAELTRLNQAMAAAWETYLTARRTVLLRESVISSERSARRSLIVDTRAAAIAAADPSLQEFLDFWAHYQRSSGMGWKSHAAYEEAERTRAAALALQLTPDADVRQAVPALWKALGAVCQIPEKWARVAAP